MQALAKEFARNLVRATFEAVPPIYHSTLSAGVQLLRRSPMIRAGQWNERPYSTLIKFLEMGRNQEPHGESRKNLFEEIRHQLAVLRDQSSITDEKRTINRVLNNLERDEGETHLLSYPFRGYVELSNFCNLRCRMCGQSYFETFDGPREHLSHETFPEIMPVLPYLEELTITGFGEAMLNPHFWPFVELLPWGGIKRLITNGVLLNKEASQRLVKYPVNEYTFSFEATDRETYAFTRSADHLEKVVQNLKDLDAARKAADRSDIRITLGFVAMKRNIEQLPEFVRRAKSFGADVVQVSFLHVSRPDLIEQSLYHDPNLANEYFDLGRKAAVEVGIEYNTPKPLHPVSSNPEQSKRIRDCYEPWEFVYFGSNGVMRPCCIYNKPMGNIKSGTWDAIWNNHSYQQLRASVNGKEPEEYCAKCWFVRHIDQNDRRFHVNLVDKHGVYLEEDQADKGEW